MNKKYSYFNILISEILREFFVKDSISSSFDIPSCIFSSKIRNITIKVTMIDAFKILDADGDGQISIADIEEANFILFKNDGRINNVLFYQVHLKIKLQTH